MEPSKVRSTIGQYMLPDADRLVVDLERSHGAYLVDAVTGKEYLDFYTYFASIPIGHNHPKMLEPEFLAKLTRSAIQKPANSDLYTDLMAEFVQTFAEMAMPEQMPHLFLISGGALAVENALKTAFDWKVRKNLDLIGSRSLEEAAWPVLEGLGTKIIHFEQSFHGRSGYTLSITNTADPRKTMYFPKFNWPRVINPKLRFPVTEEVLAEVRKLGRVAAVSMNEIQDLLSFEEQRQLVGGAIGTSEIAPSARVPTLPAVLADWLHAVRGSARPPVTAADGLATLRLRATHPLSADEGVQTIDDATTLASRWKRASRSGSSATEAGSTLTAASRTARLSAPVPWPWITRTTRGPAYEQRSRKTSISLFFIPSQIARRLASAWATDHSSFGPQPLLICMPSERMTTALTFFSSE